MKKVNRPISLTRDVKSAMQRFREVELKGFSFSKQPKWTTTDFGGPYRESK